MKDTFPKVHSLGETGLAQTMTQSTSFFRLASQEGVRKAHAVKVLSSSTPNVPASTIGSPSFLVTFALNKLQLSLTFKLFPAFGSFNWRGKQTQPCIPRRRNHILKLSRLPKQLCWLRRKFSNHEPTGDNSTFKP